MTYRLRKKTKASTARQKLQRSIMASVREAVDKEERRERMWVPDEAHGLDRNEQ
ncbi:hypothetical protein ACCT30_07765 [Rhizobium ruizarguesonis]